MALHAIQLSFVLLAAQLVPLAAASERVDVRLDASSMLLGEHVISRRGDDRIIATHRVEVSTIGLRARRSNSRSVAIMNFSDRRAWFADLSRGTVHEVPLAFHSNESSLPAGVPRPLTGGVFATAPCTGLAAADPLPVRWRGLDTVVWLCLDGRGDVAVTQWYSPAHGIVVRSRRRNGETEEFRSIERVPLVVERFRPAAHLRDVDLAEFRGSGESLSVWTPEP